MRATIFGAGRMGTAIAYAMNKMGYSLYIVDRDLKTLSKNIDGLEISNYQLESVHNLETEVSRLLRYQPDVVISAQPFSNICLRQSSGSSHLSIRNFTSLQWPGYLRVL